MANTPINIEFNTIGTESAIAEIEAVYQRMIEARLREATVSEQLINAEQKRTAQIQAEIEKRTAAIEREKQIMADMLEVQRRIGGSFDKKAIDDLLEPHRKFIVENEKAIKGLQDFQSNAQQARESIGKHFEDMRQGADRLSNKIQSLSFQMFIWQMTFQQLQGLAQGFYNIALKGNEELNQSILSTQSSLVAVTDVYKDGMKIDDSTEAIKALGPEIRKAIEGIREDSLDLVGVTSDQLIPLFQMLASNAGKITDQSKQWADPIEAAQKLTISFAASLGVMGIPIRQARQEMQSILQGYIDQNSILAKQLGITNDMVKMWQKQGVLVDELQARLAPFVEGNKLALQTINGMIPNIQEVIQEVIRVGSEPIYEPIVKQLGEVYEWLKTNKQALIDGATTFVEFITGLAEQLGKAFEIAFEIMSPFTEQIGNISETMATFTGEALKGFIDAISGAAIAVGALLNVLDPLLMALNGVLTVFNDLGITRIVAMTAGIALMTVAITGLISSGIGLVTFLLNAATALTAFTVSATGAVGVLGATGLKAAVEGASIAFMGLVSNLELATAGMGGLAAAASTLLPLLALVAVGWVALEGEKLKGVNEGFDKELAKSNQAFTEAINLRQKLKEAQKSAMADGVVSDSEQKTIDTITNQMKEKKAIIEQSIAAQKALLTNANEDQRKEINASISQLEKDLANIDPSNIALKMKGVTSIGDAYKYLADEAERSINLLKENQFQSNSEADNTAKTAIANTKQEIELGTLSIEEARKRYQEITNFSYLSAATRIAAEKELTALIKLEGDRQKDIFEKNQQEIQQLISKGRKSQVTGEQEITDSKIKAAQEQLKINKELIEQQDAIAASHGSTGTSEEKRKLLLEQEKIETEIAKLRRDRIEQENKQRLTDYDEFAAFLNQYKEQRLIGEEDYYRRSAQLNSAKLDEQIRQTEVKLNDLAGSDIEGREALLAQIADLEAKKAKILNDSIERENKVRLTYFDEQTTLLAQKREQRLIGEDEFYRRSANVTKGRLDEQIRQAREQLDLIAKTDKEGRTLILTQIADLETKKAKIINDADQRLLTQRVQAIKISTELLKLEIEKANQILTTVGASIEDENKQIEVGNKVLSTKKSLVEAIASVEKSYLDLMQAGQSIELSRAERALDYNRKLQDEKIKGTELERVYQEELQKLNKSGQDELQLFRDKQEAEANLFNSKLANLLKEQELQKQLLELDLLREKSQLNQSVNQERINVLKAEQAANEARGRTLDAEQKVKEADLAYQNAIKQGKTQAEIEEARLQTERSRLQLTGAQTNEYISQRSIEYAQQSLGMAEENLGRSDALAQTRRDVLRNKQNNELQNINEEAGRLETNQRIEQATLLTEKPKLGSFASTPTINRAGLTYYGLETPQQGEYAVEPTGDRRLDSLFGTSQQNYQQTERPPSEQERLLSEVNRKIDRFDNPKKESDYNVYDVLRMGEIPSAPQSQNIQAPSPLTEKTNEAIALSDKVLRVEDPRLAELFAEFIKSSQKEIVVPTDKNLLEKGDRVIQLISEISKLANQPKEAAQPQNKTVETNDTRLTQLTNELTKLVDKKNEPLPENGDRLTRLISEISSQIDQRRLPPIPDNKESETSDTRLSRLIDEVIASFAKGDKPVNTDTQVPSPRNEALDTNNARLAALTDELIKLINKDNKPVNSSDSLSTEKDSYLTQLNNLALLINEISNPINKNDKQSNQEAIAPSEKVLRVEDPRLAELFAEFIKSNQKEVIVSTDKTLLEKGDHLIQLISEINQLADQKKETTEPQNEALGINNTRLAQLTDELTKLVNKKNESVGDKPLPENGDRLTRLISEIGSQINQGKQASIPENKELATTNTSLSQLTDEVIKLIAQGDKSSEPDNKQSNQIPAVSNTEKKPEERELTPLRDPIAPDLNGKKKQPQIAAIDDFVIKEVGKGMGLPSPKLLQNLAPQATDSVLPNQLNQIISLLGDVKGGLGAIATTKPTVSPTINNNFNGPIDNGDTMAAYRKETMRIIENVIPKM